MIQKKVYGGKIIKFYIEKILKFNNILIKINKEKGFNNILKK
jgi:hypothetical protein